MKSLSPAIVGVTSGVAAFVVLDLLRHHGVEMPRMDWDQPLRASVDTSDQPQALVEQTLEAVGSLTTMAFAPPADAAVATDGQAVGTEGQAPDPAAELMVEPTSATPTLLAATDSRVEPTEAISRAGSVTPSSAVSAESDLARAGERAKALAAAMERLGRRLDGTANRGFPR